MKQQGFTLVEIIISLSIMLVMFSLIIMEMDSLAITKKQRYEYIASQIANNQMEDLRAISFNSLPASGTISDSALSQLLSGSGSYTVANYPSYSGVKEIVVTVNWNDGATNKSFVIKTLVSAQGINQ